MRLLRNYFVKFLILVCLLFVLYCLQTSDNWSVNNLLKKNENYDSASLTSSTSSTKSSVKPNKKTSFYNIWCIFTKVTDRSPMRRKFRILTESLFTFTSVNLTFHVIVDSSSKIIAQTVIKTHFIKLNKLFIVKYYDVHKSASEIEDIVSAMSPKFSSNPGTYYSDALFFLSLGLHKIASLDQKFAVMLDVDTKLQTDVKELFKEFDNFGDDSLFGLAPELTPVYRHILYIYRGKNPDTIFGEPHSSGGYPGYNSGVILFHLERLRDSLEYDQIVSDDMVQHMTEKYNFRVNCYRKKINLSLIFVGLFMEIKFCLIIGFLK